MDLYYCKIGAIAKFYDSKWLRIKELLQMDNWQSERIKPIAQ